MDFLDSLDLDTTHKKSHRVRSWYLYEQFKSLERNQRDAAQKLKDRSYQERILRRELSERRARRKLYDKFGICQSESRIERSIKENSSRSASIMSASQDDLFETFSEFHDDDQVINLNEHELSQDSFSQDYSEPDKSCLEDFKSVDDLKDDNSYAESVDSVVENVKSNETICEDREAVDFTTMTVVDDINKQLDTVQQNIQCLEDLTQVDIADDKISEDGSESGGSILKQELKQVPVDEKNVQDYENNLIAIWSKLVSFAYQVVQLNRGNCYYDYSSQFLTAVLACDVLRRGVNRMCHILQPYVSPVKFATDESDVSSDSQNLKRKRSIHLKKSRKTFDYKLCPNKARIVNKKYSSRKYSEDGWQHFSKRSFENRMGEKRRRASEPWRSVAKISLKKDLSHRSSTSSNIWRDLSKDKISGVSNDMCSCCREKAVNPMLKIAGYIDNLLNDIDDSKHV